MKLILTPWDDPKMNIALESYMIAERREDALLLYINAPSVILGRNQTLEAEVDSTYCAEQGIAVVRRLSGGGAVYHDYGNINFAFVCNKSEEAVLDRDFLTPIVTALANLGVEAQVGARHELLCADRKVSGTASHVSSSRQLFHGTLLHRADLTHLSRALQGKRELRGRGVASVPSPVMNLCELTGADESTARFLERFVEALMRYYGLSELTPVPEGFAPWHEAQGR